MRKFINIFSLSSALLLMACGGSGNGNATSESGDLSNYPSPDYIAGIDKCWYDGSNIMVINFHNDTLSITTGSFHDAGPTTGYVHVRDNKFCYMGMGGSFFDGYQIDDDWEPGQEFNTPDSDLTTFDVVKHDGYSELFINGESSGKDSLMVDHYYFSGYYSGKRTHKTYCIDFENRNCQGFDKPSFHVYFSDDWGEDNYEDQFGDLIVAFGNMSFNPRSLAVHNGTDLVDVLERIYPSDKELYPFTASVVLTPEALENFSSDDLLIMRNEIFARHGYTFSNESLKSFFSDMSWYQPTLTDVSNLLTDIEKKNIVTIKKAEANANK